LVQPGAADGGADQHPVALEAAKLILDVAERHAEMIRDLLRVPSLVDGEEHQRLPGAQAAEDAGEHAEKFITEIFGFNTEICGGTDMLGFNNKLSVMTPNYSVIVIYRTSGRCYSTASNGYSVASQASLAISFSTSSSLSSKP